MVSLVLVALLAAVQPGGRAEAMGIATSADGLKFVHGDGVPILARASSPDIVELSGSGKAGTAGTLVVYAVNRVRLTGTAVSELVRLDSTDGGKTWTGGDPLVIDGRDGAIGSVAAVQLPDGRVRLYFTDAGEAARFRDPILPDPRDPQRPEAPVRPPTPETPDQPAWPQKTPLPEPRTPKPVFPGMQAPERAVFSAVSEDGTRFTLEEGARFAAEGLASPDVVYSPAAGQWLMFFTAGGDLRLARSRDGLAWERDGVFSARGDAPASAFVALDSRVRVLRPSGPNLESLAINPSSGMVERDGGATLDSPAVDAAVCPRASGGYVMVFLAARADWPGR
jgi:hypothetical protein